MVYLDTCICANGIIWETSAPSSDYGVGCSSCDATLVGTPRHLYVAILTPSLGPGILDQPVVRGVPNHQHSVVERMFIISTIRFIVDAMAVELK